jgi:hypothetical protein
MLHRIISQGMVVLGLVSCVHVQSVSLTQIPEKRTNKVTATTEKWIFFAANFDNDFVDKISEDLREKCSGGKVQGILTKDEYANYFIGLVVKRRITASGYCSKA